MFCFCNTLYLILPYAVAVVHVHVYLFERLESCEGGSMFVFSLVVHPELGSNIQKMKSSEGISTSQLGCTSEGSKQQDSVIT